MASIVDLLDLSIDQKTANFLAKLCQVGGGAFIRDLEKQFDLVGKELADRDNPSEEGRSVKKYTDKAKIKVEFDLSRYFDTMQKMNAIALSAKIQTDIKPPVATAQFYLTDMGRIQDKNEVKNLFNEGEE